MRRWSSVGLVMGGLFAGACSPRAAAPVPVASGAAASTASAGSVDGGTAPSSRMPPAARRTAPPAGLEGLALSVGAAAPRFTLPTSTGGTWSLPEALRRGPVVLVFYRGDW